MSAAALTERQRGLLAAVVAEASSIDEQLLIVDVITVREALLSGHTRECGDSR